MKRYGYSFNTQSWVSFGGKFKRCLLLQKADPARTFPVLG